MLQSSDVLLFFSSEISLGPDQNTEVIGDKSHTLEMDQNFM